jgi:hypothetical protein
LCQRGCRRRENHQRQSEGRATRRDGMIQSHESLSLVAESAHPSSQSPLVLLLVSRIVAKIRILPATRNYDPHRTACMAGSDQSRKAHWRLCRSRRMQWPELWKTS